MFFGSNRVAPPVVFSEINILANGFGAVTAIDSSNSELKTMVVYSARSTGFNLTTNTIFKGHPTSAGATLYHNSQPDLPQIIPFISSPFLS